MTEKYTQLYLPKGEWLNAMIIAFNQAGLKLSAPDRCYEYRLASPTLPIVFEAIRSKEVWQDISDPQTSANAGFTGSDIATEQGQTYKWTFPLYDLEPVGDFFPRPKIILGSTPNLRRQVCQPKIEDLQGKVVYTSYPNIARRFFDSQQIGVTIVERQGTIEGRWRTNISNWGIIDVVNTGDTLSANSIEIMETIMPAEIIYLESQQISLQDRLRVADLQEILFRSAKRD